MNKQRLMLSAAMAALVAGATLAARADTTVSANQTSGALTTSAAGNITINLGGEILLKAATPAVTINSSSFLSNTGAIDNLGTAGASGIVVDTSAGDLVSAAGIYNVGAIDLLGAGDTKAGVVIGGGHTYYAPILFSELSQVTQVGGTQSISQLQSTAITVQGNGSFDFYLLKGTTIDGNLTFGGTVSLVPTTVLNDSSTNQTAIELDGNLQGNLVFDQTTNQTDVGKGARGVVVLGSITPCVDNASLSYTCGTASVTPGATALGNVGAFVNAGQISSTGTTIIKTKGGNNEGGPALIIGNSVAGGFVNSGPATANVSTPTATIVGNGVSPTMIIDPSAQLVTATSAISGPIVFGIVPTSIDSIDGGTYGLINHGLITTRPLNQDENVIGLVIEGASPTYTTTITGGLLNTGTIQATTGTSVNTNSNVGATAFIVGSYANIPKIVVSGEAATSSTFTPGSINALVGGPGGGSATALSILANANVPEIDVLQHGSIAAQIQTTTTSPDATIATTATPFSQQSVAVIDASGGVRTINNAGGILALTTDLNPASGAVIGNVTHAIDLSAGTTGNTTINNSGRIQGDIFFNSGGNGNVLNVGNTGTGIADHTGSANTAITAAQGSPVTNTPGNYATISGEVLSSTAGFAPTTNPNLISFGSGTGNTLHIGAYGYVNSTILAATGGLNVDVDNNGQFYIANNQGSGSLNANNLNVHAGGLLGLSISQTTSASTPVIKATGTATIDASAVIGLQFGSFISSANPSAPTAQTVTLISAPTIIDTGLAAQNAALDQAIPFLFESPLEAGYAGGNPLNLNPAATALTVTLIPRSIGATNADGTAGLNLSGSAAKLFPYTAAALANDPNLGTAIASSLTVYKGTSGIPSGINIAASQQRAQQVFSQFAPDVSGGARQVAVLITDQATGPVAARQRLLRSYANQDGEMTLWGEEFAGMIRNQGAYDGENQLTVFKDHGFGFSLGMDAGSPRNGWYGGALTFYSSDVIQTLPRATNTNLSWYLLTGYTDWRGNHAFLDTKLDIGYGNMKGYRDLIIGNQVRVAVGKRASLLASLGATTGMFLKYGAFDVTPHVSLDGMTMREEGYTETGGGDGFDLQVAPYYASSLRVFLGADVKTSFSLWDATLSPEARLGYRYDLVGTPVKLKTAFASTGGLNAPNNTFTVIGPDPDQGNVLAGFGLSGGTDTWNIGINYDWIRGNNASTTQVGTITLLGRI